jgi:hypothetical protein
MANQHALTLGSRLPRAAAALQRIHARSAATSHPWWSWFRRHPRAQALPCDRCTTPMLESMPVGTERVCIRCVAETRLPLAAPDLAGASAVLRTLFTEAELEWGAQWARPFVDRRRLEAILETADVVLWWITPANMRSPDTAAIGERTALEIIAAFDRTWRLRSTLMGRSLMDVFAWWRQSQAKALRVAELAAVDRRYATWIATEAQH